MKEHSPGPKGAEVSPPAHGASASAESASAADVEEQTSSAFQSGFDALGGGAGEGAPGTSPAEPASSWVLPDPASVRHGREAVHDGLRLPQVEATSSDTAIEMYVRLNAVKKPPSTDVVIIIGTDVAPFPQGGMTFINVDSAQFVIDSKKNEDGYKFIGRLANAIADAGFNVSYERSSALVSGPVIARVRIRRS